MLSTQPDPLPPRYPPVLIHTGKGGGGVGEPCEKMRGVENTNMTNGNSPSINSIKHQ